MNIFNYINNLFFTLNNSKYFAGFMMIVLNLGSRFLVNELSETQEQFISNRIFRRFIIFSIAFIATRDVYVSLIITAVFVIIVSNIFNENSKLCVLKKRKIFNQVSKEDYKKALKVKELYELQQPKNLA